MGCACSSTKCALGWILDTRIEGLLDPLLKKILSVSLKNGIRFLGNTAFPVG